MRDGWDNEEWGSLEEEPVSPRPSFESRRESPNNPIFRQNEDEHEENDDKELHMQGTDSKFEVSDTTPEHTSDKNKSHDRPTDLPNLLTNHTSLSPINSNSAWNSDSWADGEFEPLEESVLGKSLPAASSKV